MYVLGLTGGMAAGKSTAAALFDRAGVPVFDADACVKDLQKPGGKALPAIARAFPDAVHQGMIQREVLREIIAHQQGALHQLEGIIHPLVRHARHIFLQACQQRGARLCVLDIPLLWETGADKECDLILVAHAPLSVRLARIRQRYRHQGRMSEADARRLMARQMSDRDRLRRADIVLHTGLSRGHLARQIHALIHRLDTESRESAPFNIKGRRFPVKDVRASSPS